MYPTSENTYMLGLCTGSFATAAISTSRSIAELIPAGIQAVIQAFRTGLHSFKVQRDLERSLSSKLKSWSAVIALSENRAAELIEGYALKRVRNVLYFCPESVLIFSGYTEEESSVHQHCDSDQCDHQWTTNHTRGSVEHYDTEGSLLAYRDTFPCPTPLWVWRCGGRPLQADFRQS